MAVAWAAEMGPSSWPGTTAPPLSAPFAGCGAWVPHQPQHSPWLSSSLGCCCQWCNRSNLHSHKCLWCSACRKRALSTSPWKVSSQSCCKSAAAPVTPTMHLSGLLCEKEGSWGKEPLSPSSEPSQRVVQIAASCFAWFPDSQFPSKVSRQSFSSSSDCHSAVFILRPRWWEIYLHDQSLQLQWDCFSRMCALVRVGQPCPQRLCEEKYAN